MNWKEDKNITDCKREDKDGQRIKTIDYHGTYVDSVLDNDPLRDK